ncbi:hypothetical protein ACX6XY_10765 [Streptomyces sp. O3]
MPSSGIPKSDVRVIALQARRLRLCLASDAEGDPEGAWLLRTA